MSRSPVVLPAACLVAAMSGLPAMAETFVIVHGAFQTSADWRGIADRLEAAGHDAVLVDLPGRPGDGVAPGEVTMADHAATVVAAVTDAAAADPDGQVVLVGHSFGGLVISAAAEAEPAPISTLVFVAAYLPRIGTVQGDSLQELATADHHGAWQADSFVVSADYTMASVNPRDRAAIFASDTDGATADAVLAGMVDEPLGPLATPVPLTAAGFGSVRAAYVVTLRDQAISTDFQLTMLGRGTVAEAIPVDSGHVPQLTAPDALVAALLRAATTEIE
ncbi:alpha/beta fold hydrolase [Rhodobacterales bacterium HKCCE3408]|nr:alpha/beta fold hydrolase [Rhodobacterales bacterium HKCCE3408]